MEPRMTISTTIATPLFGGDAHDREIEQVQKEWGHPQRGNADAPILVLCDAPSIVAARQSLPMEMPLHKMWAQMALEHGFQQEDFYFIGLCPPIPKSVGKSKKKEWDFIKPYAREVRRIIDHMNPKLIIATGNNALRALAGKSMAITKSRGMFHDLSDAHLYKLGADGEIMSPREVDIPGVSAPVFPMLSPKLVSIQPDYRPIMDADLGTLSRVKRGDWDVATLADIPTDYRWVTDLQFLLDNPPTAIAWDTETTGLNPLAEDFRVITVQLTVKSGQTFLCRVCADYFPEKFPDQTEADILRLRGQLKQLMENPFIKKIGQGAKYDFKVMRSMGIEVCGWEWDTELMARFVNENFMTYSLDDLIRIYVPAMAGYADHFNETVDKSNMMAVPPETEYDASGRIVRAGMREYAGGDSDATFRLAQALKPMLMKDKGNLHVMRKVHMRGLLAFTKVTETYGFTFDTAALQIFRADLEEFVATETRALVRMVPAKVRRKYLGDKQGFKFSRADCVIDTLFGYWDENDKFHKGDGFGLKPKVFTDGTADEPRRCDRIPSTSSKTHLPYFLTEKGPGGRFVERYIELAKATKMLDTYAKGFEKVIKKGEQGALDPEPRNVILPQYNFKTNTKRTQSIDPNGQNFPKRGKFAKAFRRLIIAPPGKMLIASDLSQAELRIAAWMANEPTMLQIYRDGLDIHVATAALVLRMTIEQFMGQDRAFFKKHRQNAKPTNFGYIYGAMAPTFVQVAKTEYGVDFTLAEAEEIRDVFFSTYSGLEEWHRATKEFVHANGYVKSLHGLTRHLPSIWSEDWKVMSGAERNAINSPVQNFGSDLGVMALTRLAAQADPNLIRPVGFIHDQLIAEVDENYYIEGMGWLKWIMENPPLEEFFGLTPPLPIISDPEWGRNLADSTELGDAEQSMKDAVAEHVARPPWWDRDEEAVWDRFMANNDVPDYTVRDVTGAMRRQHLVLTS
jgi:uracil-DNA glycosylase family 4